MEPQGVDIAPPYMSVFLLTTSNCPLDTDCDLSLVAPWWLQKHGWEVGVSYGGMLSSASQFLVMVGLGARHFRFEVQSRFLRRLQSVAWCPLTRMSFRVGYRCASCSCKARVVITHFCTMFFWCLHSCGRCLTHASLESWTIGSRLPHCKGLRLNCQAQRGVYVGVLCVG